MKHSFEKDRSYLIWNNQRGIAHVISRNYRWFKERYLPSIIRLEKAGFKKDYFLLSNCYYMVGDIHDFNRCPKAAIKAYKKSFDFAPSNASALREMGVMYETIGQYKKASSLIKKAIQIDPDDEFAVADYNSLCFEGVPLYEKEDVYWQARERLAIDKPTQALKLLQKRSTEALQIKACAYGMLNEIISVLDQWHRIADQNTTIEMSYTDWFYLSDSVWNCSAFWELIRACAKMNRFGYGVWPSFDCLYDNVVPFPTHRIRGTKADLKRCNKCTFLLSQYHIARINQDSKLAKYLHKRYPQWREVKDLCTKLSN